MACLRRLWRSNPRLLHLRCHHLWSLATEGTELCCMRTYKMKLQSQKLLNLNRNQNREEEGVGRRISTSHHRTHSSTTYKQCQWDQALRLRSKRRRKQRPTLSRLQPRRYCLGPAHQTSTNRCLISREKSARTEATTTSLFLRYRGRKRRTKSLPTNHYPRSPLPPLLLILLRTVVVGVRQRRSKMRWRLSRCTAL